MPILAIDTASRWTAIGLYDEQTDTVLSETGWYATLRQTVELAPAISRQIGDAQLEFANLTGIAVAIGPGSYTGLRIGLAVAQGIATVYGMPIAAINTHDIVSAAVPANHLPMFVIVEAGRKRILQLRYKWEDDVWKSVGEVDNSTWEELLGAISEPCLMAGEIPEEIQSKINASCDFISIVDSQISNRSAGVLARLGYQQIQSDQIPVQENLMPNYLRNP